MSIFEGLNEICDQCLGLDDKYRGLKPKFRHRQTLIDLCSDNRISVDGVRFVKNLYNQVVETWENAGDNKKQLPSEENWRFTKHIEVGDNNTNPEILLERTIARVVDDNWANQVPVDSGLLGARASGMDLVHRDGNSFSFIELKFDSNTPLYAACQVLKYGIVYLFSRSYAKQLELNIEEIPMLRASELHLKVLAPSEFYSLNGHDLEWLSNFEQSLNDGLSQVSQEKNDWPLMTFQFESFPKSFQWSPEKATDVEMQKEVLWAIHNRVSPFQD